MVTNRRENLARSFPDVRIAVPLLHEFDAAHQALVRAQVQMLANMLLHPANMVIPVFADQAEHLFVVKPTRQIDFDIIAHVDFEALEGFLL